MDSESAPHSGDLTPDLRPASQSTKDTIERVLKETLTPEQERQKRNREAYADALREAGPEKLREARESLHYSRALPDGTIVPDPCHS